ncbi:hypothetical protein JMJ35_004393 [Cladonia borealis]|uniref:Uncharacterized protein n=1 Tax=Cladonia borealis TaxID=184061 RepID=A0AA39R1X7_9LECA|nr:hypothetical protein JMJ35_004393 [Cladonia borealis]
MGLTKKKFSLSSLRLKTASPAVELATDYDIDTSPPYSPTASEMERPLHRHSLIADLREACAIIVNETNPPDPDEEPEHGEILRRKFEEQRKAKYAVQARPTEVKTREVAKPEVVIPRSESRINEKPQKDAARKVEAEVRRAMAKEAEPERRKVIAQQAQIKLGISATMQKNELPKDQPRKEQPRRYSARRPSELPLSGPKKEQQTYVPKHVPANFDLLGGKRRPSDTYNPTMEPIEPTHTRMSAKALGKQKAVDCTSPKDPSEEKSATTVEFLPPVHATIVQNTRSRPKDSDHPALRAIRDNADPGPSSSTAAHIDRGERSGESSQSSTRSNTEYDNRGRPLSTAPTSAIITPGEDKTFLYERRPSDVALSEEEEVSPQAKAWQAHKEALRRAEEKYQQSGRAGRTGSRASRRSKRSRYISDTEDERPLSRASSIAGSISNYLRPRASQDSMRSGRTSASGLSRSESRSSSMSRRSGNGWWKGSGLRRRGSWASFRSGRADGEEPNKLRKDGGPNLNRPLPALPGLDQYRETKTHIGQLMKAGARGRKKEKAPPPGDNHNNATYPNPYQPNQQGQQQGHVKKESISAPILRNSSMERTLHRYRDSQIQPSVPISISQSQTNLPHRSSMTSPSNDNHTKHQAQKHRLDSTSTTSGGNIKMPKNRSSNNDNPSSRSASRLDQNHNNEPPHRRGRGDSTTSASSRHKLQKNNPPPPIIRGPSYHREVNEGSYPRPMEVSRVQVEVGGGENRGRVGGKNREDNFYGIQAP